MIDRKELIGLHTRCCERHHCCMCEDNKLCNNIELMQKNGYFEIFVPSHFSSANEMIEWLKLKGVEICG